MIINYCGKSVFLKKKVPFFVKSILFITCEQPNLNYKPTTFYLSIVLLMDNKFVGFFFILYTKRNSYISIFFSTIFSIKNFYLVKIIFKKYSCEI